MNKAAWKRYWKSVTVYHRRRYYTRENGWLVPGLSWSKFWRVVRQQEQLSLSDPGGNISL